MSSGQAWFAEKEAEKEARELEELKKKHAIPNDKRPTLSKYNAQEKELHKQSTEYPKLNGILCDQCHVELYDTTGIVLEVGLGGSSISYNQKIYTLQVPMIEVECHVCKFQGTRVA